MVVKEITSTKFQKKTPLFHQYHKRKQAWSNSDPQINPSSLRIYRSEKDNICEKDEKADPRLNIRISCGLKMHVEFHLFEKAFVREIKKVVEL